MIWEDRTVKKTFLRFVSAALAAMMLFGCINVGIFAADEQNTVTTNTAPSVTTQEDVNAPSAKAVVNKTIASIIAGSKTELTAQEKAVLNALALKSESFSYTEIGLGADEYVEMAITDVVNTYTVKAQNIDSGLANKWVPVGGRAVCEGGSVAFTLTDGEGTFTAEDMINVEIDYELVIGEISAETASFIASLPNTLATEAASQKEVLDYFAKDNVYNALLSFADYLPLFDLIKGNFAADTKAAIDELMQKGIYETADGKNLYFAEYLSEYRAKGLAYYYAEGTYDNFSAQLKLLKNMLNLLCADSAFDDAFEVVAQFKPEYADKKDSIINLKNMLNEKELVPVNANIDQASAYLPALAKAVESAIGNTAEHTVSNVTVSKTVKASAPDKTNVSITVSVVTKDGQVIDTLSEVVTYKIGTVLTADDAMDLEDLIADMEADLGIDTDNYVCTFSGDKLPVEGTEIASKLAVEIVWAPISYTVVIDGADDQVLYGDGSGLTIVLPGSGDIATKYIYTIGDVEIPVGVENKNYTFSDISVLKELCVDGKYIVKRTAINAAREDILTFIDAMNEAIAGKASIVVNGVKVPVFTFIPVEDAGGDISVILRITPYIQGVDYQGLVLDVMQVLTIDGNPFGKLSLNGQPLYDGQVYLQTVIDTVLSDGFGFDAICNMIDANGNIADITTTVADLANATAIDTEFDIAFTDKLGGKLIEATLQADGFTFPFYVTFEDYDQMAGTLKSVDAALETVKNYINITGENGVLGVDLVMPASFSAYYFAELLVMDQAELENIENMEFEEALAFMMSIIKPLVADEDFTLETIANTAGKAGVNLDLTQYVTEAQFATVRKALNYLFTKGTLESEAAGNVYSATVSYEIRNILINRFNIDPMFLGLVAEANADSKGISLSFTISDNTIATHDFDAIVLDPNARDLSILTTTKDLAETLENAAANTVVVLLQDVTLSSDVVIPNRVFINLNGYTITGNMTTSAAVRITNSNFAQCGGVNGELSGNFVITGGDYTADVTAMVKKGYEVVDGCVENAIYVTTKDEAGNITIAIKGDFLNLDNAPTTMDSLKDFAVDVAFDIALNMFTAASMTVNGNNIYAVELNNIVGMLDDSMNDLANAALGCFSFEGITEIANTLLEDLFDFGAMQDALDGGAIATYEVATQGWNIVPAIAGDSEKYITLNIVPTEETKTATISIVFDEMTDDEYNALDALFGGLVNTTDISAWIDFGGISYNNGLSVDLTGGLTVELDFSDDYRYAALVLASVAYATEGETRENYIAALDAFLEEGNMPALVEALDAVTFAQFIAAFKALAATECADMLAAIGVEKDEIVLLEAVYADLLNIAGKVVARLGINGNAAALGSYKVADTMAEYVFTRENVKGFEIDFSVVIVDEDTALEPEILGLELLADRDTNLIKAGFVDNEQYFVYLDAHYAGITVAQFYEAFAVNAKYAESIGLYINSNKELVCNGDILVVDAKNAAGEKVKKTYVIIILGDTNCNGRADAGDAVAMAAHHVGKQELDPTSWLAFDLNRNNKQEAGDAVKVVGKYVNWNNYVSAVK